MPVKSVITGGKGMGQFAGVTSSGELLIGALGDLTNRSVFQSLTTTNGAFNFFGPISGQQFLITSIVMTASGAITPTVQIYEAASPTTTTIDKLLFKITLTSTVQSAAIFVFPLPFGGFLPVSEGEYLNVQTDATTVNVNIIGYYHKTITTVG